MRFLRPDVRSSILFCLPRVNLCQVTIVAVIHGLHRFANYFNIAEFANNKSFLTVRTANDADDKVRYAVLSSYTITGLYSPLIGSDKFCKKHVHIHVCVYAYSYLFDIYIQVYVDMHIAVYTVYAGICVCLYL